MRLAGKTARITGAAPGNGRALAEANVREGAREAAAGVPYIRMGCAEDPTGIAIFLASDEAKYVVPQCYNVDSGQWMS